MGVQVTRSLYHTFKRLQYKCDHAGQLPESVVSSVNMLTLSVHEI